MQSKQNETSTPITHLYEPPKVGNEDAPFLALLDYVSRAHEIEICPSSVVRRPSVVRVAIISEHNARISFTFHLWFLLDYSQNQFFILKKNWGIFYEYFLFSLIWDPMGAKILKHYFSYKS